METLRTWFMRAVGGASIALLVLVALSLAGVLSTRLPTRYYLPDGYMGDVQIQYGVPGAPPLPERDGYRVVVIPRDGVARTSSRMQGGWARNEYYYGREPNARRLPYDPNDRPRSMVWDPSFGGSTDMKGNVSRYQYFFVGPYNVYDRYGRFELRAGVILPGHMRAIKERPPGASLAERTGQSH